MSNCVFCGKNPRRLFTWDISNSKADIYIATDDANNCNLMIFEGDKKNISAIKINYCPFCGKKLGGRHV